MCGGCGCSCDACGESIANVIYVCERLTTCCAMTSVIICLVLTLLIMLGMGVGLGYNYCFVDNKYGTMKPARSEEPDPADVPPGFRREAGRNRTTTTSSTTEGDPSLQRILGGKSFHSFYYPGRRHGFPASYKALENSGSKSPSEQSDAVTVSSAGSDYELKPTMVVPLRQFDFLSLFAKLRNSNKNFTLELIQ